MPMLRLPARLVLLAGLSFAAAALAAPWQWRDADGRMVYSDLPPPPEIRASQIVRAATPNRAPPAEAPAQGEPAAPQAAAAATASANATAAPKPPQTWAEKDMAFRKRIIEREEAQKKQREEEQQAADLTRACQEARASLRALESGMRMMTMNAAGEREAVDDAERARRTEATRKDIERSCRAG